MTKSARFFRRKVRRENGLTLVELMVSVAIGLLLMVIVLQIFLGTKNTYRVTDNHSRLQENGRYIVEEMSRDIRMAGYRGCAKNSAINNIASPITRTWVSFNQAVSGYETAPTAPSVGLLAAEVLANTDIIRVQRAVPSDVKLTGAMATVNANIQIDGNPDNFADDDILVVSDCSNTDIFRANSVSNPSPASGIVTITHPASVNTSVNLSKPYGPDAEVMRLSTNVYYVGTGSGGCPANMLCRKVLNGAAQAVEQLIDNVQDMQLEYGEDTDGDSTANRFVGAASIGTWDNVVSVRLHLLLRSSDVNLTTSAQPYTFAGTLTTPAAADRRMRRVFSTTVTLRNRTL